MFPEHNRAFSRIMSPQAAAELRAWLRDPEHRAEQRTPLRLDSYQQLATTRTPSGYRRIRGPAGSGKTQVLAARAAYLVARGKRVLILTYNVTLIHYFRTLVRRATWPQPIPDGVVILNFHQWCKWVCLEAGLERQYAALWANSGAFEDDERLRETLEEGLPALAARARDRLKPAAGARAVGFDALLVDEGQDWTPEWWDVARQAVVGGGECVLAADAAQDIYGKASRWTDEAMRGAGMRGRRSELRRGYRVPGDFVPYLAEFAARFLPAGSGAAPGAPELALECPTGMRWWQVPEARLAEATASAVLDLVPFSKRDPAAYSDVILVAQDCRTGAATVSRLKQHNVVVMHTFHGDSRRNGNAKRAFALKHAGVKATTVHSIKGWEVRYLVVCISHAERDSDLTALYVALSRLKASDTGCTSYITVVSAVARLAHYGRTWSGYDNAPWLRYSLASRLPLEISAAAPEQRVTV